LRQEAKRAKALEAELEGLRRESAFSRALGPALDSDPRLSYFRRGYEGEMTPEAIRVAATQAGFLGQDIPEPMPTAPPPDFSAHQRIAAASAGAGGPQPPDALEAIRAAKSPEEVMSIMESIGRATVRNRPADGG
jgi:hypothetical protein